MGDFRSNLPLGTTDPEVFYAGNVPNLDEALNTEKPTWDNRFGKASKSWAGAMEDIRLAVISAGFPDEVPYVAGNKIEALNQYIIAQDGNAYAILPTVDLPYTITGDWGTEKSNFKLVSDNSLRQQLLTNGLTMIPYRDKPTEDFLDSVYPSVSLVDDLRSISGRVDFDGIYVSGHTWGGVGGGLFYWIEGGTQADDDWRYIQSIGGVWARNLAGHLTPEMCGAKGDGIRDDHAELQKAMRASGNGLNLISRGKYYITKEARALPSDCYWDWMGATVIGPTVPTPEGALIGIVDREDYTRKAKNFTWFGGTYVPNHELDNCCGVVSPYDTVSISNHVYDLRNGHRGFALQPGLLGTEYSNISISNIFVVGDDNGVGKNAFNIDLGGEATVNNISINKVFWLGKNKAEGAIRISSGYQGVGIRNLRLSDVLVESPQLGVTINGVDGFSITSTQLRGVSYRGFELNNCKNGTIDAFVESASATQASGGAYVEVGGCENIKTNITAVSRSPSWQFGFYGGGSGGSYNFKFSGTFGTILNTSSLAGNSFIVDALLATGNIANSYRASDVYDIMRVNGGIRVRSVAMDNSGIVEGRGNSAPTSGTWVAGSRIHRNNVTSVSATGFLCTSTGSPGTWATTNS